MSKIKWKYCNEKPSEGTKRELEKALGILFPEEFLVIATEHNGGRPNPRVFDFPATKEAVFESLLRLEPENDYGILKTLERISDRLPSGCVPFASDPFGNYLCFRYPASGKVPIVFWDHEKDGSDSISPVCDDFGSLLEKLYEPSH